MDAWDVAGFTHGSQHLECPGRSNGPYGELFLFLIEKEPTIHEKEVGF